MKTHTVEILITVAQDAASKLYEGEPKFRVSTCCGRSTRTAW